MKHLRKPAFAALAVLAAALVFAPAVFAEGEAAAAQPALYATAWSLVPPLVAILLALITKEAFSSLFVGILVGGLFYANFQFEGTVLHIFEDGMIAVLSKTSNVGILIFLVILGCMVSMMNRAGG